MKTMQKNSMLILTALFLLSSVSCRKPGEGYKYEENDEPSTGLTQFKEKAIKLVTVEPYIANEELIIVKI